MKVVQSYLTKNDCYKTNRKIKVKGIMLHSVGVGQPKASAFVNSWNRSGLEVCVHAFIDATDGTIYQTLPWDHRGWHCGGAANDTHIGIEMCEPANIAYLSGARFVCTNIADAHKNVEIAYNSAVELFASLCNQYQLNPLMDGVIISHNEGRLRKVASGHVDPEHLWEGLKLRYTMDGFRKDVKTAMDKFAPKKDLEIYRVRKTWANTASQIGAYSILNNAKIAVDKNSGYSVFDSKGNKVYPTGGFVKKS